MVDGFHREALAWAAGGRGKPLVDAAAEALVVGLDSPSLRMLAGATRTKADDEADEWAAKTFWELGLAVADRFSAEAVIAFARVRAWEFLCARGSINEESPRSLAAEFYGYYVASDYVEELGSWGGFVDYFAMLESGVIEGSVSDLMPGLIAELEELSGRKGSSVAERVVPCSDQPGPTAGPHRRACFPVRSAGLSLGELGRWLLRRSIGSLVGRHPHWPMDRQQPWPPASR